MFEKPNESINVCPITGLVDVNENNIYTDDF